MTAERARCRKMMMDGYTSRSCRKQAMRGSEYCFTHSPDRESERESRWREAERREAEERRAASDAALALQEALDLAGVRGRARVVVSIGGGRVVALVPEDATLLAQHIKETRR